MTFIDYLRGWAAAAAIYILSQLATGYALSRIQGLHGTPEVIENAAIAPWLIPAALSAAAALVAVRRKVTADWWKWLLLTLVIPTVGGALAVSWAQHHNVDASNVLPGVITHVALAGVLGITAGTVLNTLRRAARRVRP